MFTGLITHIASVSSVSQNQLILQSSQEICDLALGQSIAVSGCCLTVVQKNQNLLTFDINPETSSTTNLTHLKVGDLLNLEKPLKAGQALDGHFVTGHIDALGEIEKIEKTQNAYNIEVLFPHEFSKYVVTKGSIAIEGISLTINTVKDNRVQACIIPHTWDVTNLSSKKIGDKVHLEFDMMAKFFEKQAKPYFNSMIKE